MGQKVLTTIRLNQTSQSVNPSPSTKLKASPVVTHLNHIKAISITIKTKKTLKTKTIAKWPDLTFI